MKEFTEEEKTVARRIDKKFRWMARDKNGHLYAYVHKPRKYDNKTWITDDGRYTDMIAFDGAFQEIKSEDSEPTKISDIYEEEEHERYITGEEMAVLDNLVNAWNGFIGLPAQHPSDASEFAVALNKCQELIALRVARRAEPGVFFTADGVAQNRRVDE